MLVLILSRKSSGSGYNNFQFIFANQISEKRFSEVINEKIIREPEFDFHACLKSLRWKMVFHKAISKEPYDLEHSSINSSMTFDGATSSRAQTFLKSA